MWFSPEIKIDKAKKLINFEATYSIEKGYLEYIKWYKNFWRDVNK